MRPHLSSRRIALAYVVAVATDAVQIGLGPLGLFLIDEILDLVTAVVMTWLLGFHYMLLPTLVVEAIPVAGLMPSWTACTFVVVSLRKREARAERVVGTPRREKVVGPLARDDDTEPGRDP